MEPTVVPWSKVLKLNCSIKTSHIKCHSGVESRRKHQLKVNVCTHTHSLIEYNIKENDLQYDSFPYEWLRLPVLWCSIYTWFTAAVHQLLNRRADRWAKVAVAEPPPVKVRVTLHFRDELKASLDSLIE